MLSCSFVVLSLFVNCSGVIKVRGVQKEAGVLYSVEVPTDFNTEYSHNTLVLFFFIVNG